MEEVAINRKPCCYYEKTQYFMLIYEQTPTK